MLEQIIAIYSQLRELDRKESDLRFRILESEVRLMKWETADNIDSHEARHHEKRPGSRASQIQRERTTQANYKSEIDNIMQEIKRLEDELKQLGSPQSAISQS